MVPVDLAVERARAHRFAIVAMCRSGHRARLADYVERGAEAGMIVILAANDSGANQVVALHGSVEPRLATNPLAVGVARPEPPHLVLDMSTSVASHGTIEEARLAGHHGAGAGPRRARSQPRRAPATASASASRSSA